MQAKLIVTGGKANKQEVSVDLPVTVGRSRSAGLTIAHAMVSRQHCEIYESGGLVRIRDLGSTNGTYVGGNRVNEAVLKPHDQITIGPITFEVDYPYAEGSTVIEERDVGLAGASGARPESRAVEVAFAGDSNDRPSAQTAPPAIANAPGGELPVEGREFTVSGAAPPAPEMFEPPLEWAEAGPEIPPALPSEVIPPEVPGPAAAPAVASAEAEAKQAAAEDEFIAGPPPLCEGAAAVDAFPADWFDPLAAESEPRGEDGQTASFPPRAAPKRKAKSRWWPFGKSK